MSSKHRHIIEPQSDIPRLVVFIFAMAGLVAIITLASIVVPRLLPLIQKENNFDANRTWLTREWTQSERSAEDIATLAAILHDHRINGVYVQTHVWHGETGMLVELPYSQQFIARFRAEYAEIAVYSWFSFDPPKLLDAAARQQAADAAAMLVLEHDFDGVQVQVRSVPDENAELIELLRQIRAAIGRQNLLSLTVPPDRQPTDPTVPVSPGIADRLTWSQEYKRRAALNVNEMVLMGHASGLIDATDYEQWLAYQVRGYANIINGLNIPMTYIIALPTYEAELGHDPAVENVETAIRGIMQANQNIAGVGLYPWEETDLFELDAYWEQWVNR